MTIVRTQGRATGHGWYNHLFYSQSLGLGIVLRLHQDEPWWAADTDGKFTLVTDEFGNMTFFPDGKILDNVNGSPVEILECGLSWEEAHDALNKPVEVHDSCNNISNDESDWNFEECKKVHDEA